MRDRVPERLFHFTCEHGAEGIRAGGEVLPLRAVVPEDRLALLGRGEAWRLAISWWTDLEVPSREQCGLTSQLLGLEACDRLEVRFEALDLADMVWWPAAVRGLGLPRSARALSFTPGAAPANWWICPSPVEVVEK